MGTKKAAPVEAASQGEKKDSVEKTVRTKTHRAKF